MKYLLILRVSLMLVRTRLRMELAYAQNFWAGTLGTLAFCGSLMLFLKMLTLKVGSIAGFGYNQMIFTLLVGQLSFLAVSTLIYGPMKELVEKVRLGSFDYVLLRPFPVRTYSYASGVDLSYMVINVIPYMLITIPQIQWQELGVRIVGIVPAILAFIAGFSVMRLVLLWLVAPVFYSGESSEMLDTIWSMLSQYMFPYQLLSGGIKLLSFTVLPFLLMVPGAVYALLTEHVPVWFVLASVCAYTVSYIGMRLTWSYLPRKYTSASS